MERLRWGFSWRSEHSGRHNHPYDKLSDRKGLPMKNRSKGFIFFILVMLLLCAGGVYLMILSANAPRTLPQPTNAPVWGDYARG